MTATDMEMVDRAIGATKPWNSIDAGIRITFPMEDQAQIDRCLECTYAECCNCVARKTEKKEPSLVTFEKLMVEGMAKAEIIREMKITLRTYYNYKSLVKERGLAG